MTAFCDDVFSGRNKVTVAVRPTTVGPGERVHVQGVSDCGEGQLNVTYETPTGKTGPVQLSWTSGQGSLPAFAGTFVVPPDSAGVITVNADAYCMDANYENTASAKLTVLGS